MTTHPKPDRAAVEAEAHEIMRRILYPLGLTQTAFPDRDKEMARVTGIIVEVITTEREKSAKLLEALEFYKNTSGKTKRIKGRMIEVDPDAGPLYDYYEVPICDNGETASAAIAAYKGEK